MTLGTYSIRTSLDESLLRQLTDLYQGEWWTRGRTLDEVRRVVEHSDYLFAVCGERDGRLLAFARVLTDRVFKAMIFDFIVAPEHRARRLGRFLMDQIINHPELENVAHLELYCLPEMVPFYRQWGFSTDVSGTQLMRRRAPRCGRAEPPPTR